MGSWTNKQQWCRNQTKFLGEISYDFAEWTVGKVNHNVAEVRLGSLMKSFYGFEAGLVGNNNGAQVRPSSLLKSSYGFEEWEVDQVNSKFNSCQNKLLGEKHLKVSPVYQ